MTLKRVYFLRHGDAGDSSAWQGDDATRPLSQLGLDRTERTAKFFARAGFHTDAIITSPLVRARQTAEIFAAGVRAESEVTLDDRLAPGFEFAQLQAFISEHADLASLVLVGHEPSFSAVVSELIGGGDVTVKKGALVRIDLDCVEPASGTLMWLVTPGLLDAE